VPPQPSWHAAKVRTLEQLHNFHPSPKSAFDVGQTVVEKPPEWGRPSYLQMEEQLEHPQEEQATVFQLEF
jgi:hypothetical protein